ncbi:BTAD domain-containing putative transcriptional regulator [Streptomyces sioyaensis]|uniref:BTAD domain-containing putative transcriptional regulator n=1 Tax=Streptomyces sioyaensis TaxID=67364 RepID=UPI00379D008E
MSSAERRPGRGHLHAARRPAGSEPHRPGRGALESERLGLEECFGVGPAVGHHRRAPGALQEAVAECPLGERLNGRLMPALHRCGRRTDVLSVFGHLGGELVERFGPEPSGEPLVRNAPSSTRSRTWRCRRPGPRGRVEGRKSGPGCRPLLAP